MLVTGRPPMRDPTPLMLDDPGRGPGHSAMAGRRDTGRRLRGQGMTLLPAEQAVAPARDARNHADAPRTERIAVDGAAAAPARHTKAHRTAPGLGTASDDPPFM